MNNGLNGLREFGEFRLDTEKRVLWHDGRLVDLSLKEIELLTALTQDPGAIVTKTELMDQVWPDSFVEESNLSRHIYILRKTLGELGAKGMIETVPRRGYRFAAEVSDIGGNGFVVEKVSRSQTLIEMQPRTRPMTSRLVVAALLIAGVAVAAWVSVRYFSAGRGARINSVAVLPFKTFDSGSDNGHRSLGLADLLINRLSGINRITVRPTGAVVPFENADADPIESGRSLNVDAVLDGTIYRTEDKVRVTARLLNVADGSALWTGQFERLLNDELRIQDEIASQVAGALRLNLSAGDKAALAKRLTDDPEAFQLYLKGRYEWNKRSWAGAIEAERFFRNAIEKDPQFALAYVGLADTLATQGTHAPFVFNMIDKALEIDPDLAEAYATRGFLKMFHRLDWQGSEADLKRSIELNGGYPTAHHWYAELLAIEGRFDEAKSEMRRAIDIDPKSYNFLADLGQIYYFNHEYGEAEQYCRRSLELAPDFQFAQNYLFFTYLKTGQDDRAAESLLAADRIQSTFNAQSAENQRKIEAGLDDRRNLYRQNGIGWLVAQRIGSPNDADTSYVTAMSYAFLDDKEKALDCLEKATDGRAFLSAFVKADPIFDNLRADPRYQAILQRMNLDN